MTDDQEVEQSLEEIARTYNLDPSERVHASELDMPEPDPQPSPSSGESYRREVMGTYLTRLTLDEAYQLIIDMKMGLINKLKEEIDQKTQQLQQHQAAVDKLHSMNHQLLNY